MATLVNNDNTDKYAYSPISKAVQWTSYEY